MKGKDILINIYSPRVSICNELRSTFEKIALNLQGNNDIIIAEINVDENEINHPTVSVRNFPIVKLYTADDEVVNYNGNNTLKDLLEFLRDYCANPVDKVEQEEEKEKEEEKEIEEKKEDDEDEL